MQQKIEKNLIQLQKLEDVSGAKSLDELEDQLSTIRTRCNQEKEHLRQELLLQYNKKSSEWKLKVKTLQQTLEKVQKENQRLILENEKLLPKANTHPELMNEIKILNEKIVQQQAQILALEGRKSNLKNQYDQERTGRLSAEEKFDGLYDVNVNLTNQIKRYDYLLSHGEDHLHAKSPFKSPRKRTPILIIKKRKLRTTPLDG